MGCRMVSPIQAHDASVPPATHRRSVHDSDACVRNPGGEAISALAAQPAERGSATDSVAVSADRTGCVFMLAMYSGTRMIAANVTGHTTSGSPIVAAAPKIAVVLADAILPKKIR